MKKQVFYVNILFLFFAFQLNLIAQTRGELELRKIKAREEIEKTNKIIREVSRNKNISLNKIRILNKQVENREELINQISGELKELDKRIKENEYIISSFEKDIKGIKTEYGKLLQSVYQQRPPYFELIYLFSSADLNQAYKRTLYLRQYSQYRKKQVKIILQMQELLDIMNVELAEKRMLKEEVYSEITRERVNLSYDINKQERYFTYLQKREKNLKREIRKNENIAKKLDEEINRILAEEAKKAKSIYKLTPSDRIISDKFEENKGKLPWPTASGIITGKFGVHPHPVMKNIQIDNGGIDITTTKGSSVRNIFEGVVMKIIAIPGANQTVIIRHGSFLTVYRNIIDVKVRVGEKVDYLQEIGRVYSDTEGNGETILHFRIYKEKKTQNPELWLSR